MGDGKLAIYMPTYRFDATARHCIDTVAGMGGDDVSVFIGDNSCNPDKWAFLRAVAKRSSNCHVFCHETNIGIVDNWNFLINRSEHEFVCMASDDDSYSPDYFLAGLDELRRNPQCSVASGLFLFLTWQQNGLQAAMANSNLGATPAERVAAYAGYNAFPYSVHRSSAVTRFLPYMKAKPFLPSYSDQFLTYTLLSAGTHVVDHKRKIFVYNNDNWSDEKAFDSDAQHYVKAGLPRDFQYLHTLCWAVEVVHYFNSVYRPPGLSDAQASAIVRHLFDRFFDKQFRPLFLANIAGFGSLLKGSPDGLAALHALMETPCDQPKAMLDLFITVLRVFSHDIADRYRSFVDASLQPLPALRFG